MELWGYGIIIRKLLTFANDHEILTGASFVLHQYGNALCHRMANEVQKDVLPYDSHVTVMEAIKDEFGLRTSATTTPGLLKVMFAAIACRKVRMQRRSLGLGVLPMGKRRSRANDDDDMMSRRQ